MADPRVQPETTLPEGYKQTEIGTLPEEWRVAKVGEIGDIVTGTTPSTKVPEYYARLFPFISPGDIAESRYVEETQKYLSEEGLKVSRPLPQNTVLVVCIGATIGKVAMTSAVRSATNQQINAVIAGKEASSEYLYYALLHRSSDLPSLAGRAAIPIVNKSNFARFPVPLPPSREQKTIAHILSTVQKAKESTAKVIETSLELKRSLMNHLFTYGPVSVDEAEQVPLKETEIGLVPEHWDVAELGTAVTQAQYGLSQRGEQQGAFPILRMNNLNDGQVTFDSRQYVDVNQQTLDKFRLREGDLLFNRTNSYELVGKTALFALDGDYLFASYLIRVVTDKSSLTPQYANYYLNSAPAQSRLRSMASRGVSQSNINATKLKSLLMPLPPLHEQQVISRMLRTVDEKIAAERSRYRSLDVLFKTLLHNLMTGRIRGNNLDTSTVEEMV